MKRFTTTFACVTLVGLVGCAKTEVTGRQTYQPAQSTSSGVQRATMPRPDRILVYDFAATPGDLPSWSAPARRYTDATTTVSSDEVAKGRELGAKVADELVEEIRQMGLPATHAAGETPRPGDLMLVGYFESIDEGSAVKRVVLGFGSGGADLQTKVEGYRMTAQGPRELGSRTVDAGAGKSPGLVVPLAVGVATHNPVGLVAGTALHAAGEVSGKTTIEGSTNRTSKKIGEELRGIFQQQGWI